MTFYEFSRPMVEKCCFGHFLARFGPGELPRGEALARREGTMSFFIGGYDSDPRELYEIPEVRRFYSRFFDLWPYWLYFCALDNDGLAMMVSCRVANLASFRVSGAASVGVHLGLDDLAQFLSEAFPPMNRMFGRAGLPEERVAARTGAVMEYFNIPGGLAPS